MKFFEKPTKHELIIKFVIFLWVSFMNLIIHLFNTQLGGAGFYTWAFFIVNILFFLTGEPSFKKRFVMTTTGSIVGVLLAAFMVFTAGKLVGTGMDHTAATMIPLVICLFVIIVLHAYVPLVINNISFAYFSITLISAELAIVNAPKYIVCSLFGNLIANGGCVLIITLLSKHFAKKAAEKAEN